MIECSAAALENDFSALTNATVRVSAERFTTALESLMMQLALGFFRLEIESLTMFITYRIEGEISEVHTAFFKTAVFTLRVYLVQVTQEIADIKKQISRNISINQTILCREKYTE